MAVHDTFSASGVTGHVQVTRRAISCDFRQFRVYSEHYSAYAEVYQPDPPGLIRDDLRLLPPWRGSSSFPGTTVTPANRTEIARRFPGSISHAHRRGRVAELFPVKVIPNL